MRYSKSGWGVLHLFLRLILAFWAGAFIGTRR